MGRTEDKRYRYCPICGGKPYVLEFEDYKIAYCKGMFLSRHDEIQGKVIFGDAPLYLRWNEATKKAKLK